MNIRLQQIVQQLQRDRAGLENEIATAKLTVSSLSLYIYDQMENTNTNELLVYMTKGVYHILHKTI